MTEFGREFQEHREGDYDGSEVFLNPEALDDASITAPDEPESTETAPVPVEGEEHAMPDREAANGVWIRVEMVVPEGSSDNAAQPAVTALTLRRSEDFSWDDTAESRAFRHVILEAKNRAAEADERLSDLITDPETVLSPAADGRYEEAKRNSIMKRVSRIERPHPDEKVSFFEQLLNRILVNDEQYKAAVGVMNSQERLQALEALQAKLFPHSGPEDKGPTEVMLSGEDARIAYEAIMYGYGHLARESAIRFGKFDEQAYDEALAALEKRMHQS